MFERKPKLKIIPETETERLKKLKSMISRRPFGRRRWTGTESGKKESPAPLTLKETERAATRVGIVAAERPGGI